jgi:hypothetical protein
MWRIRFLNPRSDPAFVEAVEAIFDAGVSGPDELEARLRTLYPRAVVRERSLSGDLLPAWYVYRDGRWVPHEEQAAEETA